MNVRGVGNVKKTTVNPLCIHHDVIVYAKVEVEKQDLKTVIVKRRERQSRIRDLGNDVVSAVVQHKENENSCVEEQNKNDNHISESLKRHQDAIITRGVDDE